MGRSSASTDGMVWIVSRVLFYIYLGTSDSLAQKLKIPDELILHSSDLRSHFCSCPGHTHIDRKSLCWELCPSDDDHVEEIYCFIDKAQIAQQDAICKSHRQTLTFVCNFADAIVCSDEQEICVNPTREGSVSTSLCICKTDDTATPQTVQNGSCRAVNIELILIACCVTVILVIILIILFCFINRRRRVANVQKRTSKPTESAENDSEDQLRGYEQHVSTKLEYSYAYGHRGEGPVQLQTGEPDLDEQQADHYYSHLKHEGEKNGAGEAIKTDQKIDLQKQVDKDATVNHEYFELEKLHKDEQENNVDREPYSISENEGEEVNHSYAKIQLKQESQNNSSGYEIAKAQHHDDVKQTTSNQDSADHSYISLQPKTNSHDSGYEVATVTSGQGNQQQTTDIGHSYFTLEPPKAGNSSTADSGYELANITNEHDDYDHLERNEPLMSKEGAIP